MWTIDNGEVRDENGTLVSGYTGEDMGDTTKTCGITIESVQTSDLGMCICDHIVP